MEKRTDIETERTLHVLSTESHSERYISEEIRAEVINLLDSARVSKDEMADLLGVPTQGIDLMLRKPWGLSTAVRVADAIGVYLSIDVGEIAERGDSL